MSLIDEAVLAYRADVEAAAAAERARELEWRSAGERNFRQLVRRVLGVDPARVVVDRGQWLAGAVVDGLALVGRLTPVEASVDRFWAVWSCPACGLEVASHYIWGLHDLGRFLEAGIAHHCDGRAVPVDRADLAEAMAAAGK